MPYENYGSRRPRWRMLQLLLATSIILLTACNGLFYHPIADQIVTPEQVKIAYTREKVGTSDGESLAVWILKSQSPKRGSILHFHGNAENMSTHFLFVAWLTKHGYDVVTFDYRGYGQSSGSIDREGSHLDGLAMLRWMDRRKEPFAIVAQSLGGAIAIPALASLQLRYLQGLIIDSSFASYRDVSRKILGKFWLTWALQYPLSFLVSDELSPLDYAKKIDVPILQIHGTADQTIPMSEAEALFAAFSATNKTFLALENGQHTEAMASKSPVWRNKILTWLKPFFNKTTQLDEEFDEN